MDTSQEDITSYKFRAGLITFLVIIYAGIALYFLAKFGLFNKYPVKKHIFIQEIPAPRGEIIDRTGFKIATNMLGYNVYQKGPVPPKFVPYLRRHGFKINNDTTFWKKTPKLLTVGINISAALKDSIYRIKGLTFRKAWFRYYNFPYIFEPVIGFVQRASNKGLGGLEFLFDSYLKGKAGKIAYLIINKKDSTGLNWMKIPIPDSAVLQPKRGCNLILTIDQRFQTIAYEALKKGVTDWHAKRGAVIVENPRTGEVLAFAVYPSYNPSNYSKTPSYLRKIWPITDPYEPGSIFKAITYGTALESGISPKFIIDTDHGKIKVDKYTISDVHPLGKIPMEEALIHSSNVGTIKLAFRLGRRRIYNSIKRAGIGKRTGIKLPGENPGHISNYRKWSRSRFANIAIGYGLLLNSLHVVTIYGAIANGGLIAYPRIVKRIDCGNGSKTFKTRHGKILFDQETSKKLTDILVKVVERGTGTLAKMDSVDVAGKTGTANKLDPKAKSYNTNKRIVSFVGYFPAYSPRFLIYVVVDEPHKKGVEAYGGTVAAPIFKEVAKSIINLE